MDLMQQKPLSWIVSKRDTTQTTDLTPHVPVFCAVSQATACQLFVAQPRQGSQSTRASERAVDARGHELDLAQHKESNVVGWLWPVMHWRLHFKVCCEVLQYVQYPVMIVIIRCHPFWVINLLFLMHEGTFNSNDNTRIHMQSTHTHCTLTFSGLTVYLCFNKQWMLCHVY